MARSKKMTLDEYIRNRDDMTWVSVSGLIEDGKAYYEVVVRVDGTFYDRESAEAAADYVSKTTGIKRY